MVSSHATDDHFGVGIRFTFVEMERIGSMLFYMRVDRIIGPGLYRIVFALLFFSGYT